MFSKGYQMNNPDTISVRFHPDSWILPEILVDAMADEKRQINHELDGVDEGVAKYEKYLGDPATRLADTSVGRKIFKETMSLLIPAIAKEQEIAIDGIANAGRGVRPVWWWYLPFVAPEKLAYISLRSALAVRMRDNSVGRSARQI